MLGFMSSSVHMMPIHVHCMYVIYPIKTKYQGRMYKENSDEEISLTLQRHL